MKPVEFSPLASEELITAAREYERRARGLGATFIMEVERVADQLSQFPESAPMFGQRLRRKLLRRFPYALLYSVRTETVWVVAIMHQRRGPAFIAKRLKIDT